MAMAEEEEITQKQQLPRQRARLSAVGVVLPNTYRDWTSPPPAAKGSKGSKKKTPTVQFVLKVTEEGGEVDRIKTFQVKIFGAKAAPAAAEMVGPGACVEVLGYVRAERQRIRDGERWIEAETTGGDAVLQDIVVVDDDTGKVTVHRAGSPEQQQKKKKRRAADTDDEDDSEAFDDC